MILKSRHNCRAKIAKNQMAKSSLDLEELIAELQQILQLLDQRDESLAAIKLDEAIHILRERQKTMPQQAVENSDR